MVRSLAARAVLVLSPCLLAAAAGAEFFDGGAKAPELPVVNRAALTALSEQAPSESAQTGKDLYSFTKEEAAVAKKKFGFRPSSRGYKFDANVPADIQAQMKADLAFIGGIQGSGASPLHRKIFGSVQGSDYTNFFETRVNSIGMNGCGSAKAVACVIPFRDPSKMWLTPNFVKFSHPQVSRMMVVFHEARHTETRNGNWAHATCPTPFLGPDGQEMRSIWTGSTLAGEDACDETPLGSYGSSTIMLKNIQKFCTNCSDKVKMDAGLYADDQLGRIIDADAKKQMQDDLR